MFAFPQTCTAYTPPDAADYIPSEVSEAIPEELEANYGKTSSVSPMLSLLKDIAVKLLEPVLAAFGSLISCVMLTSLFSGMSSLTESEAGKKMFSYIVCLCLGLILYKLLLSVWQTASETLSKVTTMMNAMTVSASSVYALSGNAAQAALSTVYTMSAVTLIENVISYAAVPLLKVCFGFSLLSCVTGNIRLGSLAEFVRKTFTTVLVTLMTLLSAVMSFQSILARSADSMAMRTVRLVSGHFIPIVGGFVSEAASTVAAGMGVLKSSVGIAGITALCVTLASPILLVWMHKTSVTLCAVICDVLGQDSQSAMLKTVAGLFNFISALLYCVGVIFTIELLLLATSSSAVCV